MTDIMRAHNWGTNAALIADVAKLGYIEGDVLDATYGEHGGFWKEWEPERLTTNDLNAEAACHHQDFRNMHIWFNGEFDTVVYDPPYKLNGTPTNDSWDQRFGTGEKMTLASKLNMIFDGAHECLRVTRKWLLVKCMDQVVSGHVYWMAHQLTLALEDAQLVDRFDFLITPRKQPHPQQHTRSNYSTLLVFRKS